MWVLTKQISNSENLAVKTRSPTKQVPQIGLERHPNGINAPTGYRRCLVCFPVSQVPDLLMSPSAFPNSDTPFLFTSLSIYRLPKPGREKLGKVPKTKAFSASAGKSLQSTPGGQPAISNCGLNLLQCSIPAPTLGYKGVNSPAPGLVWCNPFMVVNLLSCSCSPHGSQNSRGKIGGMKSHLFQNASIKETLCVPKTAFALLIPPKVL